MYSVQIFLPGGEGLGVDFIRRAVHRGDPAAGGDDRSRFRAAADQGHMSVHRGSSLSFYSWATPRNSASGFGERFFVKPRFET